MSLSFQEIILKLQEYWSNQGCHIVQAFDIEAGAATLNPMTALRVLDSKEWNMCQTQYCRRPKDARYGYNPNRLGGYYQFQVIMKPVPENIQDLCISSLEFLGIQKNMHDFRFVEDNWANPSIGATGLGYEVWCDGMEVTQFTYMQQLGGIKCPVIPVELTYGLERIAMYVQEVDNIYNIVWDKSGIKYGDIHKKEFEIDYSKYYQEYTQDTEFLVQTFAAYLTNADALCESEILMPAYENCLKASHILNILDARGAFSQNERADNLLKVRNKVVKCCQLYLKQYDR